MTLLFVGPGAPDPANVALEGVGLTVRKAVPADRNCVDLWGANATRQNVDRELQQSAHVFYFGHGQTDALGNLHSPLVDAANVAGAAGRVVVAMACSSGAGLAVDAVARGVTAYLGFSRPVLIPIARSTWSLAPWSVAGIQLLRGASVSVAHSEACQAFCDEGDRIRQSQEPTYIQAQIDAAVLWGTALAFVLVAHQSSAAATL